MRPSRFSVLFLLTALLLGVFAGQASAAKKKKRPATPTITSIKPLNANVGDTLTIRGKNFIKGRKKNTVVFLSGIGRAVFVKDAGATSTRITVKLPEKLSQYMVKRSGKPIRTRFRVRVLARRFGRSYTKASRSPKIGPRQPGKPPVIPPNDASQDCDKDKVKNGVDLDDDNDLLSDVREKELRLDPCDDDTDGDAVEDGFEYQSALDFNSRSLPYPGKRPYPNPLDPSDADTDYDGDTLTQREEFTAWVRYGGHRLPLSYSDGTQHSGGVRPAPVGALAYLDLDHDGEWTDDEKDVDGDGLSNYTEQHGPLMGYSWWLDAWDGEEPYKNQLRGLDWLDPDTDGDTLKDGDDDIDHDGYTNRQESDAQRDETPGLASPLWTQPFNPCVPNPEAALCSHYIPAGMQPWPPFKDAPPSYFQAHPELLPLSWPFAAP